MAFVAPVIAWAVANATTIAIVGAAVSAVGMVTGEKGLTKLGGLIGLAGGAAGLYGSLAGAGSAAAAGSELAGSANAGLGTSYATAEAAGAAGLEAGAGASLGANVGESLSGSILAGGDVASNALSNTMGIAGDVAGAANAGLGSSYATAEAAGAAGLLGAGGVGAATGGTTASSGIIGNLLKNSGDLTKASMIQVGGKFIGGLFDKTDEQLLELKSRALGDQESQMALDQELARRKAANANAIPGSTGMSVNQNASLYQPGAGPSNFRFKNGIVGTAMGGA